MRHAALALGLGSFLLYAVPCAAKPPVNRQNLVEVDGFAWTYTAATVDRTIGNVDKSQDVNTSDFGLNGIGIRYAGFFDQGVVRIGGRVRNFVLAGSATQNPTVTPFFQGGFLVSDALELGLGLTFDYMNVRVEDGAKTYRNDYDVAPYLIFTAPTEPVLIEIEGTLHVLGGYAKIKAGPNVSTIKTSDYTGWAIGAQGRAVFTVSDDVDLLPLVNLEYRSTNDKQGEEPETRAWIFGIGTALRVRM